MAPNVIVSYDDTENDRDGLALGQLLAKAGATLTLAYVRHAQQEQRDREVLDEHQAQALLSQGANLLGNPDVPQHVVLNASTGEGLWDLATREHADAIVFGSEYRTAAGRVSPGTSAQRLLNGGPAAIGIAPAKLREKGELSVRKIGVIPEGADPATEETARTLAASFGATVVSGAETGVDLLVVGSRPEAEHGHVMLSASSEYAIENASCPVLVVPHGLPLSFAAGRPLEPAHA